jgi:hypothetical protein
MKLRDYQQKIVDTLPDRFGMWLEMRVGKTPTAIRLTSARAETALVIVPKSVKSHWENEIRIWNNSDCKFNVIGRDRIRLDYKELVPSEAVIIDEVHAFFSNYKSQAFKALIKYFQRVKPKYVWLLTGTPMPSSSWGIYSYGLLLGKNWDWFTWSQRYFVQVKMGNRRIPIARPGMEKELQVILRKIGTVLSMKDVSEVVEDENIIEEFSLNKKQESLIKEFFDPLPIVRYSRQAQLESGVMKTNGYRDTISFDCEKDKRIVELAEANKKIIIVARYHDQLDKIYESLKKLNRNIYKISGREKLSASEIAPIAEKDETAIVLCQADTAVGYSLASFNIMVFASLSYSFVNLEQMRARMKAVGKKEPCQYIYLLTSGDSIDRAIYDSVSRKRDFNFNLYEKKRS